MAGLTGALSTFAADASVLARRVPPGTIRRTLRNATPHARSLLLFLTPVVLDAIIGIANPLIYREIVNPSILCGAAHRC
jgi:ATP-binding cassette subfamily B protein